MFQYKRGLTSVILSLLAIMFLNSCRFPVRKESDGKIIKYRVEYLQEKAGAIPTSILPRTMTVTFAPPYAMNNIEGFFGQFSLSYIAHLRKGTVTTVLKLFDKRFYYKGKPGEIPCGLDPMEGMQIRTGEGTKVIAGFDCNEYLIAIPGKDEFSIYSTNDIPVDNANATTPYRIHEGVLLEFRTRLAIMDMQLTAQEYREEKVLNSMFVVPENYSEIDRESMETYIRELFAE